MTQRKYWCPSRKSLDSFADWKSVLAASPFVLLKMLFLEDISPSTEVSVAKLDEYIPEEKAPIFLSLFCFFFPSHFLGTWQLYKVLPFQGWPKLCGKMSRWLTGGKQFHFQVCWSRSRVPPVPSKLHPRVSNFTGQKLNQVHVANQKVHTYMFIPEAI